MHLAQSELITKYNTFKDNNDLLEAQHPSVFTHTIDIREEGYFTYHTSSLITQGICCSQLTLKFRTKTGQVYSLKQG